MNSALPVIAVTSGEPAGIGPDICLLLAGHDPAREFGCRSIILADRYLLAARARECGLAVDLRDYAPDAPDVLPSPACGRGVEREGSKACLRENSNAQNTLTILHQPLLAPVVPGRLNPANSPYVLALLDRAILGCQRGEFAALVTAPLHKGVINDWRNDGLSESFTGHTEYLAAKTGAAEVVMMLTGKSAKAHPDGMLRVALVTTHLSIREVADAITPARLEAVIRILAGELRAKYGFKNPRIIVSGLNPHAGEDGYLGREEIEVIRPTLEKLRSQGFSLIGPLPADTLFTPPILATGDAVLAMYHDQGLAPLKYAVFGQGINVTLGLSLIRASVDHGTALTLAGSGKARPASLLAAIREAARQVVIQNREVLL
ncbi:MAG: 4-hydroxythreonine-4-phosphate dehydrogenase PdxA [Betaproteobacteria bacterium]|nr:4-hydroxythreonine-4-phosphate dehydrogenase PdxA [Betaproteobacteria bacterium]